MESGVLATQAEGVTFVGYEDGCLVYELGSGTYHFTSDGTVDVSTPAENVQRVPEAYDLSGRRIPHYVFFDAQGHKAGHSVQRGIYIVDGRKVVK